MTIHVTSGPAIERAGDLAAMLSQLGEGDVLFIDEIHRLPRVVEEVLYPAMEDFQIDIVLGKGPAARSIRLDLPRFTLVGATTRTGSITGPLRDRFGLVARLDYYEPDDLVDIVTRAAGILGVQRRRRGRLGDRPPRPGHARASPTGCCAASATSPRCGATAPSTCPPRPTASPPSASTSSASTRSTAPSSRRSASASAAARSACPRWPSASASRPRPSRTSTSRSSSRAACSCARPAGGWPPRRPSPTSASPRPAAPRARIPLPGLLGLSVAARRAHWRRHGHGRARLRPAGERHRPDAGRAARRRPAARRRRRRVRTPRTGTSATCRRCSVPATWSWSTRRGCCRPGSGSPSRRAVRSRCCCSSRRTTASTAGRRWSARAARCRRARRSSLGDDGRSVVGDDLGEGRRVVELVLGRRRRACSTCSSATARCRCRRTSPPPLADPERYQTTYADRPGSVAAPTAGLHLTPALLERGAGGRRAGGARSSWSSGSARSGRSPPTRVEDHEMHAERYRVPARHDAGVRARRPGGGHRHHQRPGRSSRPPPPASSRGSTELFIHGDRPFARGRRAADQLPPAALVAARARRRVRRAALAVALRRGAALAATASSASATPCSSRGERG